MKKKLLTLLIGVSLVVALVTVPLITACAPEAVSPEVPEAPEIPEVPEEPAAPKVAKIGYIQAFTGPAAMWGLPGLDSIGLWADLVNEAGGLRVGDERYLVEMISYDDESMPSKALLGARKLILEDNVDVLFPSCGECVEVIQPLCNEHKKLNFCGNAYEIHPDYPNLLGPGCAYPCYEVVSIQYLLDKYPEIKTAAAPVLDTSDSLVSWAWDLPALEANGIDIVYAEKFSPETTDFAPVVSAMLATDPDLICLGSAWPEFAALIVEQLYHQGFEGKINASEFILTDMLAKVPVEYIEGAVSHWPLGDDPALSGECHEFYNEWMARYGPGTPEDVYRIFGVCDSLYWYLSEVWQYAVEGAGTLDGIAVRDWLLAQDVINHPMGPAVWWGKDIYGVDHSLMYPQPITEVHNGVHVLVDSRSIAEWMEVGNRAELVIKWHTELGLMWWQR